MSPWAPGTTTSEPSRPRADTTPSNQTPTEPGKKSSRLGLLTESRAQVFRRCKREEELRYVEGLMPPKTGESLRFGTLIHHALEEWWVAAKHESDRQLEEALQVMRMRATPETDAYELARAQALLEGYDARWGIEPYEVLAVEQEFRAPLVNPETQSRSRTFERAGKVDVIARDPHGELVIEHKTSGEDIGPGSTFWARLRIGGQSSGYIRGAESLGYQPRGVLYDVLKRPALKPLQANTRRTTPETPEEYLARVREDIAENPDKYFQRGLVVRLESEMAEHDQELWQLGSEMREYHRLELAPRNTDACQRFGSMCSYFPLCSGEASQDAYARAEWVHPELSQSKEEV